LNKLGKWNKLECGVKQVMSAVPKIDLTSYKMRAQNFNSQHETHYLTSRRLRLSYLIERDCTD